MKMGERMSNHAAEWVGLPRKTSEEVPWRMYLIIGCVGLILTGIVGYGFLTADRMNRTDAPLTDAVSVAKLETTRAHHQIERIASGESFDNIESALAHLDQAHYHLQEIFNQEEGVTPHVYTIEDPGLQREIQTAKDLLSELKAVSWQRLASREVRGIGKEVDSRYLERLNGFMDQIDRIRARLDEIKAQNFRKFRASQIILAIICVSLTLMIGFAFNRFERRSASDFFAMKRVKEHLENEMLERKSAEMALRESEARFRQIAETIEDIFWLQNTTGKKKIIYINPAFESVWGIPCETLYAEPDTFLRPVHPEDTDIARRFFDMFPGGGEEGRTEFRICRPDGAIRWIHVRGFPICGSDGEIQRAAGFAQDITTRKRHERRLKELLAEIRNFAAIVSHDLRAPLVNLKGFVREIARIQENIKTEMQAFLSFISEDRRKEIAPALEKDLPEALDFITASASRMETMIQAVLRLSRIEERQMNPELIDMNALLNDLLESFAYQIKQQQIRVMVVPLPEIRADRFAMEQVFSNLISNAIHYLASDRIGEISIGAECHPDETVFHVRDNGMGIQSSDLERIFDIFQRIGTTTVPGEGMGLTYTRSLIRRHGGRIWCDSRVGEGSTFFFSIAADLEKNQND
jgi:PAS domain S-box-containing protein